MFVFKYTLDKGTSPQSIVLIMIFKKIIYTFLRDIIIQNNVCNKSRNSIITDDTILTTMTKPGGGGGGG